MKTIVHVLPSAGYTENTNYQDNVIARQNVADGYKTYVITCCKTLISGKDIKVKPLEKIVENGVNLIMLPYKRYFR